MPDRNDWNRQTVEAFRAHKGQVGGVWEGRPLLLLTTTGAKSGQRRTNPVMYLREGDRLFVFASSRKGWRHTFCSRVQLCSQREQYPACSCRCPRILPDSSLCWQPVLLARERLFAEQSVGHPLTLCK
jgi:F420H(2)-dependent quinone reductase